MALIEFNSDNKRRIKEKEAEIASAKAREARYKYEAQEAEAKAAQNIEEKREETKRRENMAKEKRGEIAEARRIAESGAGDAIMKLLKMYKPYVDMSLSPFTREERAEKLETRHTILSYISGLQVPHDKENLRLMAQTLVLNADYIKDTKKWSESEIGYKEYERECISDLHLFEALSKKIKETIDVLCYDDMQDVEKMIDKQLTIIEEEKKKKKKEDRKTLIIIIILCIIGMIISLICKIGGF